jgi:hypothetical protein
MATEYTVKLDANVFEPGQTVSMLYRVEIPVVADSKEDACTRVAQAIGRAVQSQRHMEWLERRHGRLADFFGD